MLRVEDAINQILNTSGNAVSTVRDLSLGEWCLSAGFVFTSFLIGGKVASIYRDIRDRHEPTPHESATIERERKSALAQYTAAMADLNHEELGSAEQKINEAIREFNHTLERKSVIANLTENKVINAKLLYLRAQIYYVQAKYAFVERDLLKAIELDGTHTLAINLLTHLYINQLYNDKKAKVWLDKSLELSKHQIFASFYQSMMKQDIAAMDEIAEKIMSIYEHKFAADIHPQTDDARQHILLEWRKLTSTTPYIAIPYMLVKWLHFKIEHEPDARALMRIANSFNIILNEQAELGMTQLRIMMKEACISALFKVAKLKASEDSFNADEIKLLESNGLRLTSGNDTDYFFPYPGENIDRAISKLFSAGTRTDYLLNDKRYHQPLTCLIIGWIKQGWLSHDKNPELADLRHQLQAMKSMPDADKAQALSAITLSNKTIAYFLATYVEGKGWKPWFRAISADGNVLSLLVLACQEQGVSLSTYMNDADVEKHIKCISTLIPENPGVNSKTKQQKSMHVIYNTEQNEYTLLHELSTPSRLYRWMALNACWELLGDEPDNRYALEELGSRTAAALPTMAEERLAAGTSSASSNQGIRAGLSMFIKKYNNPCPDEKVRAEAILAQHETTEAKSSLGSFFTRKVLAVSAVVVVAATAGFIYSKE